MEEIRSEIIDVERLQPGMYVELELGWLAHPFPTGSFKITSDKQIEIIRSLGRKQIRYVPSKSDLSRPVAPTIVAPSPAATAPDATSASPSTTSAPADVTSAPADVTSASADKADTPAQRAAQEQHLRRARAERLATQQRDLAVCERRFGQTVRQYKQAIEQVHSQPHTVMTQCLTLVTGFVTEMLCEDDSAIRLLSDSMGDKLAMHPVNISIICLLLGKQLGLSAADMTDLGLAAFLHDIGKLELPDRVRWLDDSFSANEIKVYQEHVAQGVRLGQSIGLPAGALLAIAQHHEMVDGSGFPAHLKGDSITLPAKILALVNRYENLCNPSRPAAAVTPHEALALIFAQLKSRFDPIVLRAFIRMMGVYPTGSVVQLNDQRYAMVVSVNSARPLKPRLIVFDAKVPRHEALILDLETAPDLGIKRSLKPASLPRAALDYLSPRQRMCYFFERAVDVSPTQSAP
ncbi:HD-GYP domain-containing protein [Rhodoferax antarcticus]|uniref:HD-GYP domain-containing protein n=1 Tax=Rhodoferax antarcticus TaxID=81479 RepID=UPI002224DA42|nr:HD-GYP domain-containing protein [Rhodoferax antarcticus]MCW2312848.1 HD-GYP domain-containing protein (c-di-GMP phosphodiesterase class II) [Rhodoferax antarcticus]